MTVMNVKGHERLASALEETLHRATSELAELRAAVRDTADEPAGLTVRELAERFNISEAAVLEFVRTAGEVLGERTLSVPAARRAALLAASGQAWQGELGPLLTSAQVRELLGDVSRQRVDELLRARRLIGLRDTSGRRRFPAFQFHDGRPLESLVAAHWLLADASVSEWTAASWCVSPDEGLGGKSPAQWASDAGSPERLATIARQDAARLAQ